MYFIQNNVFMNDNDNVNMCLYYKLWYYDT